MYSELQIAYNFIQEIIELYCILLWERITKTNTVTPP